VATTPPPCSPKSIYVLAKLLGIQPLYDSAFADIKSKVSVDNVVDEVFSWVTAGHKDIQEMQFDLLNSNPKNPKTIALMKENIGHISDGSLSHCAESLKFGLNKAFDLKKLKKYPPGVKLRCSNGSCSWYSNHVSYLTLRDYYCQSCRNWMQCAGCGYNRTSNYTSCQSCRKNFI